MADQPSPLDFSQVGERLLAMAATDPQLRALIPNPEVTAAMRAAGLSYQEIIATALAGYADRPALGSRAYEIRADPRSGKNGRHYLPAFTTISYSALAGQIEAIATAWRHHPRHRVSPGDHVAFIAFNGAEMVVTDTACVYAQAIAVPVQANLPAEDLNDIFRDIAPVTLVASIDTLAFATEQALVHDSIRSLIVINLDERDDDERAALAAARARLSIAGKDRVALATYSEIIDHGRRHRWTRLPRSDAGMDAISMLMYTSGSTGTPKGAIIHEAIAAQFWTRLARYVPTVGIAYAPMNHFMGRMQVFSILAQGGTVCFSLKSDMSTLLEDIRLVRPTTFQFMPRFADIVYQNYQSDVQRLIAAGSDPQDADRDVRAAMHAGYLGDRLVVGSTGSSPTAPEVRAFIRDCFGIAFSEGYGSTEAGGGATTVDGRIVRATVLDYKLRDVPELGYYTTDTPYPRGELLVKTNLQIQGYFKRPEATAAIFDDDGYLLTGDIMEERGPDHIVWLDRRNNVIKLSQAEFVAIGPLEATYLANNALIDQIYIYGSSYRPFLLAVVVPDVAYARESMGHEPSLEELRAMVLEQFQSTARAAGLKSFEIPRDVVIEIEPFSLENGLLSSVRKPLRPKLKRRYGDRLEAMYQEMDRQQQAELASLRAATDGASTRDRVVGALKANLGLAVLDPDSPQSYRDLGGDSLGAVALSLLFEEMFGVAPPVSMILSPAGNVQRFTAFIDTQPGGTDSAPTFATVHGPDARSIRASDLKLNALFDAATLEAAAEASPPTQDTRTILMTGATGFLGRFLCLEWMERLAPVGGKVICIVRAADDATARARLDEVFGTIDPALTAHFHALAADHLEVIAGDLAAPLLGLSPETFNRLANDVDRIVHPGALVNHRLSYQNLFEPNVIGTAELVRLALTGRQKSFDYVSTVGVPASIPHLTEAREDADARVGNAEIPLSERYASGYAASKWAGEIVLIEAHEQFGLPVNIFRPNMILAHSRYVGQINIPDMFTRLLYSLVAAGIAPGSFYDAAGRRPNAHYDGLPVDVLAAAMQEIGERSNGGFKTYHTINFHHDDGISLDSIADWVASAGYRVRPVPDHADWLQRFGDALRNLPDHEKQHSSLTLLGHFAQPHAARPKRVRTDNFATAIRDLRAGPDVPHISEGFIHKYLGDMRAHGLIP